MRLRIFFITYCNLKTRDYRKYLKVFFFSDYLF